MPKILRRDSDGAAIYDKPDGTEPEWNIDGDPGVMNENALCAAVARDILGCKIGWWGYYRDWCCGCDRMSHACDSQCSAIATSDQLASRVIAACDKRDIPLRAHPKMEELLRAALYAWRATS